MLLIRTLKPLLQSKSCKSVCLYSGFPPTVPISGEAKKHFYPNYEKLSFFHFVVFVMYYHNCVGRKRKKGLFAPIK